MNEAIRAKELRVISESKGQIGIISRDEALKLAEDEGLDLVLISPDAKPPVAKIMDYGNINTSRRRRKKRLRKSRKK